MALRAGEIWVSWWGPFRPSALAVALAGSSSSHEKLGIPNPYLGIQKPTVLGVPYYMISFI